MENKVGYTQRNWCVPLPCAENLQDLQKQLNQKAEEDGKKNHYAKGISQEDLWEQEKPLLLELPAVSYEVCRLETATSNGYGEISLDKKWVRVHALSGSETVFLKVWWDRVDVLNTDYSIVATLSRGYAEKDIPVDITVQLKPFIRKPRALDYSAVLNILPASVQQFLQSTAGNTRASRLEWTVRMLEAYSMDKIEQAISSSTSCHFDVLEHSLILSRFGCL